MEIGSREGERERESESEAEQPKEVPFPGMEHAAKEKMDSFILKQ